MWSVFQNYELNKIPKIYEDFWFIFNKKVSIFSISIFWSFFVIFLAFLMNIGNFPLNFLQIYKNAKKNNKNCQKMQTKKGRVKVFQNCIRPVEIWKFQIFMVFSDFYGFFIFLWFFQIFQIFYRLVENSRFFQIFIFVYIFSETFSVFWIFCTRAVEDF